jgi:hypothetical protein
MVEATQTEGRRPEGHLARNPLSVAGAALTTVAAVAFIVYATLDAFELIPGPYAGLFGYLLVPAVFVFGLLLIPIGMWREGRRRRRGRGAWNWPAVDLGRRRTRQITLAVLSLTLVNLAIVTVAGVGVVHYTESNRFCGQVCHTPMTPQFTAHQDFPHAEVECVSCHVAPGAGGMIHAKLNGTRQLFLLATGGFSRPIPEPIGRVPGALDTCAHCHTPGRPNQDLVRTSTTYGDDEQSSPTSTTLTLHMGANHWHARSDTVVEYIAADQVNQTIPYVRVTDTKGKVTEYFAEGVTAPPAGTLHRMDCLDCHNRPAHTFYATPDRGVDAAMGAGAVNHDLPFIHREMIAAVTPEYPSQEAADTAIASHLREFYRTAEPRLMPEVDHAVAATQQLYRRSVFPAMKVGWGTYLSQNGHSDVPGCFRCHDDSHKSRDGQAVRQDCELCHHMQ